MTPRALSLSSISAALLLLSTCAVAQRSAGPGVWRGAYEVGGAFRPVIFTVPAAGGARVQSAFIDSASVPANVEDREREMRLTWARGAADTVSLAGTRAGELVRGEATAGGQRGTFVLRRVADVPLEGLRRHVGDYRLGDGSLLSITGGRSAYQGIAYMHWRTGRSGVLFALSADRYVAGPRRFDVDPVELTVEFRGPGEVVLRHAGGRVESGRRVELSRGREVTFTSGAARLAATLTLPVGHGPFPAVVLLHGSDIHTRFTGTTVTFFASRGIAVLSWDKRGNGGSTGSLETADFDTLAADAEAAIAFLRRQPEIDSARVGVWGISQGGWPAAIVAARDTALAFVILHAGSSLTPAKQGEDEQRNLVVYRGGTADDVREALDYQRRFQDLVRTGRGRASLDSVYQALRGRGFRFAWSPAYAETPQSRWQRAIMDFDPVPYWARSRAPMAAFFGANDPLVPPETNLGPLRDARAKTGSPTAFYVIPGVNHLFEMTPRMRPTGDYPIGGHVEPTYYETMARWLRETLGGGLSEGNGRGR